MFIQFSSRRADMTYSMDHESFTARDEQDDK